MELHEINMKVINELAKRFGKDIKIDIEKIMEDCYFNGVSTLVNEPQGENQNEEYKLIKEVWVDQWSVGDSGDSYEGRTFCLITKGIWLMMPYAM